MKDYSPKVETIWEKLKRWFIFDVERHLEPKGCRFTKDDKVKPKFEPLNGIGTVTKVVSATTVYVRWQSGFIKRELTNNLVKVA